MKKDLGYGAKREYMPIVTDEEGRPKNVDIYISDKIYTEGEMVKLFRESSNPRRQKRSEMSFFPPLTGVDADGYYIAFDRGNRFGGKDLPVGRVGWKYLKEHGLFLTAGIKVIDMYRNMGLARQLWVKRDSAVFGSKPAIGMASNFQQGWLDFIQREGWTVDPPVESLPESIQDEVRETIEGEKPRRLISKNIDMAMKKAWEVLKMPKPYRGPDIRNEAQYNAASLQDRKKYHNRNATAYNKRLSVLRRQSDIDLTDTENPIYQEMKNYQNTRNFHGRQEARLRRCIASGKTECNDFYSAEAEGDKKRKHKKNTTPTGKLDSYVELSLEAYNNLTGEQKAKYHAGMARIKDKTFHDRMMHRLRNIKGNLPTFPSPKYGGETTQIRDVQTSREEYDTMDNEGKSKFHSREAKRNKTKGNNELEKFHRKMYFRIKRQSNLPSYYSPEHEQEES